MKGFRFCAYVLACLWFSLALVACGSQQTSVEAVMEDGVEVVLNRVEPSRQKRQPQSLDLTLDFVIDTEDDTVAEKGLGDIASFAVDDKGGIYLLSQKSPENFIHKFDSRGNHLLAFGPKGQGPGELILPSCVVSVPRGVAVTDTHVKLVFFAPSGELLREERIPDSASTVLPLAGSDFLVFGQTMDPDDQSMVFFLKLMDGDWKDVKELDGFKYANPYTAQRIPAINPFFVWSVSPQHIFVAKEKRGYEILVFDFAGGLVRKIRKESKQIPIPDSYKQEVLQSWHPPLSGKLYFPAAFPPLQGIFVDDRGRLYVMTYEKVDSGSATVFDIFDPDGIFWARTALPVRADLSALPVLAKANRLYCTRIKPSGYQELAVYTMSWE